MKKMIGIVSLLLLIATAALADDPKCGDIAVTPQCKPFEIVRSLSDPSVSMANVEALRGLLNLPTLAALSPAPPEALSTTVTRAVTEVENGVRTATVATTPPQSSDARIHASQQNFNIPLSFAINTVERSKDEQSLIVRFNKADAGPFSVGMTGTITQPKLSSRVEKNITPEANRATVAKALGDMLEETDDVALSLHFAPDTPDCTLNRLSRGACYGQEVRAYDDVLNSLMATLLGGKVASPAADRIAIELQRFIAPIHDKKFSDLDAGQQKQLFDLITLMKTQDALDTAAEVARREKAHVPNLAMLIENQPQWTLTLNASRRDRLVGANEQSAGREYQRGRVNLNTVVAKCKTNDADCLAAELKNPNTGSFVFGVSIKQTESYHLDALPVGATTDPVVTFPVLNIDRLRSYLARLQYGYDLHVTGVGEKPVKLSFLVIWEQTTGGDTSKREHDTRFVAGTTVSIPVGDNVVLPVTLNYANHPNFLKDAQKGFGMHFG